VAPQDPLLPQHLSHWGIDAMRLERSDRTMAELEVELNKSYDFSKVRGRWGYVLATPMPKCMLPPPAVHVDNRGREKTEAVVGWRVHGPEKFGELVLHECNAAGTRAKFRLSQ
jgi:hypothetical protein